MGTFQTSTPLSFHTSGAITTMNPLPIAELVLPWIEPSQFPHIKQIIEQHGGNVTIDHNIYHLAFPAGTVQQDQLHMVGVPRQKIIFPDGWWLIYEHADKGRLPVIVVDAPEEGQPGA